LENIPKDWNVVIQLKDVIQKQVDAELLEKNVNGHQKKYPQFQKKHVFSNHMV